MLTPTMKLKRNVAKQRYGDQVNVLYAKPPLDAKAMAAAAAAPSDARAKANTADNIYQADAKQNQA